MVKNFSWKLLLQFKPQKWNEYLISFNFTTVKKIPKIVNFSVSLTYVTP